jgi:outer membrane receptor for ferric coprogen and ferric-rhodotorulic acid
VYQKGKVYFGLQSTISRNFNLNADISRASFENYPFFVTDTSAYLQNSFSVIYDDISVAVFKGEFEFVKSTKLQLGINAAYNHYKTTNQEYAWYKPAYVIGFTGKYNLQNKIVVTANATINGAVWALTPYTDPLSDGIGSSSYVLTPEKLKGWADISLGTEYRFNKALSFWLNFNNLANSKYFNWYNYRSYGINIMGGVSYSF